MLSRINSHLDIHQILKKEQFGFMSGLLTTAQVTSTVDDLNEAFNQRKLRGTVLMDIQKAIDTLWQ